MSNYDNVFVSPKAYDVNFVPLRVRRPKAVKLFYPKAMRNSSFCFPRNAIRVKTDNAALPFGVKCSQTVTLQISVTALGGTPNYTFVWGDGTANTVQAGVTATHTYASAGRYSGSVADASTIPQVTKFNFPVVVIA